MTSPSSKPNIRAPVVSTILGPEVIFQSRQSRTRAGHILDTFFQMAQVCFQLRECRLELMWREQQAVSTVPIHHPRQLYTNLATGPLELLIAFPCSASNSKK